MTKYMLLVLAVSGSLAHAACEDMYFWAQILQPGRCTPRSEVEKREITFRENMEARQQQVNELRRNAQVALTREALATTYGVPVDQVSVSMQRTREGFGVYYVNNGQIACEYGVYGFGCLDTGGHYAKSLSAKQLEYISNNSWNATIDENGNLVPGRAEKPVKKRASRN